MINYESMMIVTSFGKFEIHLKYIEIHVNNYVLATTITCINVSWKQ